MKKHLWKGNLRTECGRLTTTMDPKYLEEKRNRVTCKHCLRQSGALAFVRKVPKPVETLLEVWTCRMFRPSRTSTTGKIYDPPAGWIRVFREYSDAEKYVLKACRALLGRHEDHANKWTHRGRIHTLNLEEARFDIVQHRVI